ncbi:facilitated trehalose transporter Tret1-like [Linepithema humile]|uniref:facilitated trehalose transporter Tret1-like n=1 Tax=Linepithema humile TaxID=83485 RepID=UPI0006237F9D|nr:PREDICTED: facilitated trehalose transporter Tret1-like [Linepithema humile]
MSTEAEKGKYTTPGGSKTWEYLTTFICSIMCMGIGAIIGWSSPSIVKLMAPDSPIPVTASNISTLVAMIAVGHILGPPLSQLVVDRKGRKTAILLSGLSAIICWGLTIVATNIWILYVTRFMGGLYLGQFAPAFAMYIGEIASPDTRGAATAANTIMFNFGILGMFIVAPYLSIPTMAAFWLIMSVGCTIAFWFMPESPYYLAMKDRMDDAEAALEKLRGRTDVSEDLQVIVESVSNSDEKRGRTGGLRELLTVRANRRAFIIINLVSFTHHFGGYHMIISYGQLIFKSADLQMISDHTASVVIGVMQVTSVIGITFLVDKLGRRPLLLFSGVVVTASNLVIGVFFYAKEYLNMDVSAYSTAMLIATVLLVFGFNCGLMPLQLILMSEIFGTEIKALAICLLTTSSGCIAVVSVKLYILIAVTWGYGHSLLYLAFCVFVAVSTLAILRLLPETKGKTFVQIQKELSD